MSQKRRFLERQMAPGSTDVGITPNGVDGKPYGMEAGQFIKNKERATEVFLRLVDPFLVVPAPVPRRFWEEEEQRREKLYQQAAPVFRRCMLSRSQGKKPRKG